MGISGNGPLLDLLSGLSWFNIVCWKDAPRDMFSIHNACNSICSSQIKVEWWKLVWYKYVILQFSFILWLATLLTQDKLMAYGTFQVNQCFLYVGGWEDIDLLFFSCPFTNHIWYDLCSKILISFRSGSWTSIIFWISLSGGGNSLQLMLVSFTSRTRGMLDFMVRPPATLWCSTKILIYA